MNIFSATSESKRDPQACPLNFVAILPAMISFELGKQTQNLSNLSRSQENTQFNRLTVSYAAGFLQGLDSQANGIVQ